MLLFILPSNMKRGGFLMQNGRLASLLARKAQLEAQAENESDHLRRTNLKRQKLMVKEEIERISA
jgi:hypothetical protein